jgi:hypothetical protein
MGDLQIVQMSENIADCMNDFAPDVAPYAALEARDSASASTLLLPTVFSVAPAPPPSLASSAPALSQLSAHDVALIVSSTGEAV